MKRAHAYQMHRRTFFKVAAAGGLALTLDPVWKLPRFNRMPIEYDESGLKVIGNNVRALSFYDNNRVLRAQIYLDDNNALNVSATVVTSTTTSSGTPAGIESAAFLTLAADTTLLGERVFTAGSGLTGSDGGPGAAYTLAVDTTIPRTTRQIVSGAGLTGGGDLSSDRTLAVGAGAGISVAADAVAIDVTANLTWTGAHIFQGSTTTRTILPEATDTYDLGSSTKLWRKGWLAELDAVVFAQNTITLLGGWLLVTKNEVTLPADVTAGATSINFGTSMTVGDFVLFRAAGAVEYVSVGSLVSGTTYNVTRNLDGSGANAWAAGTPGAVLGQNGNGRIELNAFDTPRVSIIKQGATYNAQTEVIRLGDLNGAFGIATEIYGIGIGDYAGGNYLRYDPTNGFVLKAGAGGVTVDAGGISLVTGTGTPSMARWLNGSDLCGRVYTNVSSDVQMFVRANGTSGNPRSQLQLLAYHGTTSSENSSLTVISGDGTSTNPPQTYVGNVLKVGGASVSGFSAGDAGFGGSIRASAAIAARAYNSADFVHNSTGTWLLVTFDSERFDNDGLHSTSSNTGRLTASVAGVYQITFNANWASNSTGFRGTQIRLNAAGSSSGGTPIAVQSVPAVNGDRTGISLTTIYNLAAGDYVEVFTYQNSGGNLNINSIANYSPDFAMARIA